MKDKRIRFDFRCGLPPENKEAAKRLLSSSYGSNSLTNFKILQCGNAQQITYKTLHGFIKILKQQNKFLKKNHLKVKFDIVLPVPE